jgi:hypothetical protein
MNAALFKDVAPQPANPAKQQQRDGRPVPDCPAFPHGAERTNIFNFVGIVTNCGGSCPKMANMEEMPGVAS